MRTTLAVLLLACAPAAADQLILRDGSRIKGEFFSATQSKVILKTGQGIADFRVERIRALVLGDEDRDLSSAMARADAQTGDGLVLKADGSEFRGHFTGGTPRRLFFQASGEAFVDLARSDVRAVIFVSATAQPGQASEPAPAAQPDSGQADASPKEVGAAKSLRPAHTGPTFQPKVRPEIAADVPKGSRAPTVIPPGKTGKPTAPVISSPTTNTVPPRQVAPRDPAMVPPTTTNPAANLLVTDWNPKRVAQNETQVDFLLEGHGLVTPANVRVEPQTGVLSVDWRGGVTTIEPGDLIRAPRNGDSRTNGATTGVVDTVDPHDKASVSSLKIRVELASVAPGDRNLRVTWPSGREDVFPFTIFPPVPTITSLTPNALASGSEATATLTGTNLTGARIFWARSDRDAIESGASINWSDPRDPEDRSGLGIEILGASASSLSFRLRPRLVSEYSFGVPPAVNGVIAVATPNGTASTPFTVMPPPPRLATVVPNAVLQDSDLTVSFTGWLIGDGVTGATISGTGVTATLVRRPSTLSSGEQLSGQLHVVIAKDAAPGNRTLTVTTAGGSVAAQFTVQQSQIGYLEFSYKDCDDRDALNPRKIAGLGDDYDDIWFRGLRLISGWKVVSVEFQKLCLLGAADLVERPTTAGETPYLRVHRSIPTVVSIGGGDNPPGPSVDTGYWGRLVVRGPAGSLPCSDAGCRDAASAGSHTWEGSGGFLPDRNDGKIILRLP
ncbi:MAG: hypothetical protein HY077_12225 [Elusimicrobia bacterium]|nr:hypothetical protein [Elusimicrobiota bacterium]